MTPHRRFHVVSVCSILVLVSVALVFWPRKRPEANAIPQARESVAVVGETTAGTPVRKAPVAVVAETPTAVKATSAAMVPPPVREAVDATSKEETLPRVEDYEAVLFTKTSAATLRALADDPAANTVLRLAARHALSQLSE